MTPGSTAMDQVNMQMLAVECERVLLCPRATDEGSGAAHGPNQCAHGSLPAQLMNS